MKDFLYRISYLFKNRITIIVVLVCVLFSILTIKLFSLQIKQGDYYTNMIQGYTLREINVSAPRGNIYDRYGRPLAVNQSSYTVNLDASVTTENLNEVLLNLVNILDSNGDEIVDEFPISENSPYIFLESYSDSQIIRWKKDMNLDENLTASDCFYSLRTMFEIDKTVSDLDARKILNLRCQLYKKRYSKFIPVTVAYNVKKETIAEIEENKSDYPCVYIDVNPMRYYPEGKYFSHLLGYIRGITEDELKNYEKYGYTINDIVGKDGIEKTFELDLNGTDGKNYVEVDSMGRRINTIEVDAENPIAGNDVFLTVDSKLQEASFNAVEDALTEIIISRLTGQNKNYSYSLSQLLVGLVESGTLSVNSILDANLYSYQGDIREKILNKNIDAKNDKKLAREILISLIENQSVSNRQCILALIEQGVITGSETYIKQIKNGNITSLQVILDKLREGQITPGMTGLDPSTGSAVVTDIHTGDVLASVTYPSYDNNEFVNNFNNQYYMDLQNNPSTPLVNRPFTEPRAPGSTFKMLVAVAGLKEGLITPTTTVYDKGTFKDAGRPYARCWIGSGSGTHGSVNVSHALEVSCNYFFYDLAYRMGNSKNSTTYEGIKTLNKYMEDFGLNSKTGVEIYELYDSRDNYPTNISSPEYKEFLYKTDNANPSDYKWYDGDTIRTAIGQSLNNYTPATLTKYVSTIANGGKRYSLHFLDKIQKSNGQIIQKKEPNIEKEIDIGEKNLKAIHDGMLLVTQGEKGTLRNYFKDYPINVAAKSGTAQQSKKRSNHTIFVAFAPYEEPQIAITVIIPFGEDDYGPAPVIAKDIMNEYFKLNSKNESISFNSLTK